MNSTNHDDAFIEKVIKPVIARQGAISLLRDAFTSEQLAAMLLERLKKEGVTDLPAWIKAHSGRMRPKSRRDAVIDQLRDEGRCPPEISLNEFVRLVIKLGDGDLGRGRLRPGFSRESISRRLRQITS
jgi:hypothetical protein